MTWSRLYQLVNFPWAYGPRWWRAHRYSKARAVQLDAEHIAWARELRAPASHERNHA